MQLLICTAKLRAKALQRHRTSRALGVQLLRGTAELRLQAAQVGAQCGQLCTRCAPARRLCREAPSVFNSKSNFYFDFSCKPSCLTTCMLYQAGLACNED